MKLHEIENVGNEELFRRIKVESGYMYNAWNFDEDAWDKIWTFVPYSSNRFKDLEHHEATTVGLWATDRPDLVKDTHNVLFQIKGV